MAHSISPTGNASAAAANVKSDLENHASRIRKDISALADSVTSAGSSLAGKTASKAGDTASDIMKASEHTIRELRTQLDTVEKQIASQVRERPVSALALAAGIGFLIAFLARR